MRDGNESAQVAHVHLVGITGEEESLPQELRGSVSDLAIALHLAETQTTVATTSFHRLAVQDLDRTTGTTVDLVVDHVLEPLVIGGPDKYLRIQLASGEAVVHDLVAGVLVAILLQQQRDFPHVHSVIEWCRVTDFTLVRANFTLNRLHRD